MYSGRVLSETNRYSIIISEDIFLRRQKFVK